MATTPSNPPVKICYTILGPRADACPLPVAPEAKLPALVPAPAYRAEITQTPGCEVVMPVHGDGSVIFAIALVFSKLFGVCR